MWVRSIGQNGMETQFYIGEWKILKDSRSLAKGHLEVSLRIIGAQKNGSHFGFSHISTIRLSNELIFHVCHNGIAQMVNKGVVRRVKMGSPSLQGIRKDCVSGKSHRPPITKEGASDISEGLLYLVHLEVF